MTGNTEKIVTVVTILFGFTLVPLLIKPILHRCRRDIGKRSTEKVEARP